VPRPGNPDIARLAVGGGGDRVQRGGEHHIEVTGFVAVGEAQRQFGQRRRRPEALEVLREGHARAPEIKARQLLQLATQGASGSAPRPLANRSRPSPNRRFDERAPRAITD
jgi:hypothetical protein